MEIKLDVPFTCPDNIRPHLERVMHGEYDVKEIVLPTPPRVIDLGANCGSFSIWATHRWPGCVIEAYEPHPETFKILEGNLAVYSNVTAHNWGIGTAGMRALGEGKYNCGENSFHSIANNPFPTGQHCEVRNPLTLPGADILKLDIEGCEMEVLEPLITEGRKYTLILLEWHNHSLRREIDALLKDYTLIGCEVQHIGGRGVSKYMRTELGEGLFK